MATGAKQVKAGQAYVELATRDRALIRGLNAAQARLRAFAKSASQIGDTMLRVGRQMATVGAALSAPFAISAFVTAGFEKSMSRVLALTQATPEEFKAMSDAAKKMGRETVFSASQAADAMGFFALAGFKTKQILDALRPTLDLAAAGQIEIAEAADIVAKIMAGMGLEAEDLARAVDVLTKGMTTANTDLRQLGDAMKYVGPIAKSVNMSIEETVAAIQALSNAGIQADMAGTSLRGMILALTSPSVEAAKWMDELGIQTKDAAGNFVPLIEIIGQFERAMDGMGTAERAEIIGRIFPARQAVAVIELISQGADQLRTMTASLKDATGTASRVAGTQLNNLSGDVIILRSALEGLAIAIGESLTGPLRAVTQAFTKLVGRIAAFAEANRGLVLLLAGIAVSVTAAGVGLIGLGLTFKVMAIAASGLALALGVIKTALLAVTSPVGIVIGALAALAAAFLLYTETGGKAIDWLKSKFGELGKFASDTFQGISDALAAGDIAAAAKVVWTAVKVAWAKGALELQKAWLGVQNWFDGMFDAMGQTFVKAWIVATAKVKEIWVKLANWHKNLTTNLGDQFVADGVVRAHERAVKQAERTLRPLIDEARAEGDVDAVAGLEAALEARKKALADERDAQLRNVAEINAAGLAAIDEQTQAKLDAIEREKQAQLQNLEEIRAAEAAKGPSEETLDAINAAQAELDKARREWDEARAKAAAARAKFEEGDGAPDAAGGPGTLPTIPDFDFTAAMQKSTSIRGTFSAFEAMGMGAQSTGEKIAKATEETAKNTRKIALNLNGIPTLQFA